MSMPLVLDASALLAVTLLEPEGDFVLARIQSSDTSMIHMVNVYEVVHKLMVRGIPEDSAWQSVTHGGITIIEDMGDLMTRRAVRIKMSGLHLSMADCYCLALGETVDGEVLTSDKGFASARTSATVVLFR